MRAAILGTGPGSEVSFEEVSEDRLATFFGSDGELNVVYSLEGAINWRIYVDLRAGYRRKVLNATARQLLPKLGIIFPEPVYGSVLVSFDQPGGLSTDNEATLRRIFEEIQVPVRG